MVPTFLKNMRELAIQLGADPSYLESSRNNVSMKFNRFEKTNYKY